MQAQTKSAGRVAAGKKSAASQKRGSKGQFIKKPKPETVLLGPIHRTPGIGMIFDPFEILDDDILIIIDHTAGRE